MEKDKKDKNNAVTVAGVASASADTVQRYGSGVKEHFVAYSGMDNENSTYLQKSLSDISKSKINPDYEKQNLKQQAGFSAEVKSTARANAERAINGESARKTRTDDLGRVNDPLYDHMDTDSNGKIIRDSGTQMKFVGNTPVEAWRKLHSQKFQKYHDANVPIEVPADYYDGIIKEADINIGHLQKQAAHLRDSGNVEAAKQIEERIKNLEKIKKNLRRSNVSAAEAMEARLDPALSTLKDIGRISHRAGMEAGKMGAAVGGALAIVQNLHALFNGEIEYEEAAANVAKTTVTCAAMGYGSGFCGSALKGLMQNTGSGTIRSLSKTNLPGIAVAVAVDTAKTMLRYMRGEITGLQCFNELGQKGTGMVSSAMFTTIGQIAIPIPVVGGIIGGMVGYAMSSASYGVLSQALNEAHLAREERALIEKECEEHIQFLRLCRMQVEETVTTYLRTYSNMFNQAFEDIKLSLELGDIDGFISGSNLITRALGKKPQFESMREFDKFMRSDAAFEF